jgi:predicted small lipoprotein YifL
MKKIFVLLLATAMIFALAACGATPNGTDNNNTQDGHQAETPDASYEAPQITELYNEDFDYTDRHAPKGREQLSKPRLTERFIIITGKPI